MAELNADQLNQQIRNAEEDLADAKDGEAKRKAAKRSSTSRRCAPRSDAFFVIVDFESRACRGFLHSRIATPGTQT